MITQRNRGKGAAIRSAISHIDGDIVVIQDADGEYDPGDVPRSSSRSWTAPPTSSSARASRAASRSACTCSGTSSATASSPSSPTCSSTPRSRTWRPATRSSARDVLRSLVLRQNDFAIEPEITAQVCKRKLRIYELPVSYYGRQYSEGKKITWRDGIHAVRVLVAERFKP